MARNPNNELSPLFKRLTRLFSGPIVDYRRQTAHEFSKGQHLDKYSSVIKSPYLQPFKKTGYNPFEILRYKNLLAQNRFQRYLEFNAMELMPELSSALDIYADEVTVSSPLSPMLQIETSDPAIKATLEELFYDILNVEFNLFGWSRTMCKYGDFYLYLDIDESKGIQRGIGLPTDEMERLEGEDHDNPDYIRFHWLVGNMTFENWQIAHFRSLANDKYQPYGTSIFDPARRIYQQLTLLENAMISYRIVRAPERKVHYIDVGNIAPEDVEQYMQQVISTLKRNYLVDETTGEMEYKFNTQSIDEDLYIPVRRDSQSRVESLPGGQYVGAIDDVKYLRDKLFSAIKIPASYLSRAEGAGERADSLTAKDLRFSRTVQRLQRAIISELEKIGMIQLYVLGFRNTELTNFKIKLGNPSKIAELQELEHWRTKFEIAAGATDGFFSRRWVGEHIFGLSEAEMERMQREMFRDRWLDAQLDAVGEGEGSEGSDLGAALGEDDEIDLGEEFGEEGEAAEDMGAEPAGEDSALLAAPAKRDDDEAYLTPGAKGKKYTPVKYDKRDTGAKRRHMSSLYGKEKTSSAARNVFKGAPSAKKLTTGIISENETSIYNEEEKILMAEHEIKQLMNSLEVSLNTAKTKSGAQIKKIMMRRKTSGE